MKTFELRNPLMKARELRPLQKALRADSLYHGRLDDIFGPGMAHACEQAKWRLGYPKARVRPTGGQRLLDFLDGNKVLPPDYRLRRHLRGFGISRDAQMRQEIVRWALWGVAHEPEIHYSESAVRDDWLGRRPGALPMATDCSGYATACYRWGGGPDPNNLGFQRLGFTGTMLEHGRTIPLFQARPGDLVIWGVFPGHHVALIVDVSNPADPMIVSHGSEQGPLHIHLSSETAAQQRSFVVKSYIGI